MSDVAPGITLYGTLISRPFRVLWMLHECGVPFRHVDVRPDGAECSTTSPWYLALNPNARVPTLDDGGFIVWETAAINFYLAERYRPAGWGDTPADHGRALQWAFFMTSDIEPTLVAFRRLRFKDSGSGDPVASVDTLEQRLLVRLGVVADALLRTGYLQGATWGLADFMVASMLYSLEEFGYEGFASLPALRTWLDASYARPAARAAITAVRHQSRRPPIGTPT
ncbi:MAG: glutathione S-transferase family protein [Proteobacteria bacterium]|nr:glutathione S-transferase family protein [Pseudomonadota bacterium]